MNSKRASVYVLEFLFCLVSFYAHAQYSNLKFEEFSTMEGLSSSTCLEVFQDSEGFIWVGTIDGLNKYDGYGFEIFRPEIGNPKSISSNRVSSIAEDSAGNLWIGTTNGLNVFDKEHKSFYRINLQDAPKGRYLINTVFYDSAKNKLWVGTKNGLYMATLVNYDTQRGEWPDFRHFTHSSKNEQTIDHNDISSIFADAEGNIWVGSAGEHLNRYVEESETFERVLIDVGEAFELGHLPKSVLVDENDDFWIGNDLSKLVYWDRDRNTFELISPVKHRIPIFDLYLDKNNNKWVATDGFGLYLLDEKGNVLQHIENDPEVPFSLPNNQPSKILQDDEGIFWFATYNKGFAKLALAKSEFGHYFYKSGTTEGLSARIAQSVMQDKKGRIWIGTDGGGLNLFEEDSFTFRHYRHQPAERNTLSSDKILFLKQSYDGSIWVCTWDGGLNRFYPQTNSVKQFKHNPNRPNGIGQNTVWCAVEDKQHRLWVGTQTAGLNVRIPETGEFKHFTHQAHEAGSILSNFVFSLFIDTQQRLLIGTSVGVSVLDLKQLEDRKPEDVVFETVDETAILGKRINFITEDHEHNIWLGTDLGLHKLNADLQLIRTYSVKDGLPSNLIIGIQEDNQHDLWLTTKSGISRLDVSENSFENFNVNDGLQGMEFQSKSITKTEDGRIIAGGINGFNIFDPTEVGDNYESVQPVITTLKLFNEVVNVGDTIGDEVLLKKSINQTNELLLRHDQGYITFEYVALHLQNPERVKYAYRMAGLENEFVHDGKSRAASYSGLAPGSYTFEVKAYLDGDLKNAKEASINIRVLPPLWKTWWAYVLYVLGFFILAWLAIRFYVKIVREEKEHELDQLKLKFFINVSHEFKTPLTLILNPVDKILSAYNDPEEVRDSALRIQRSARRLLSLMNQLLDFRKMDLGKTPLELVKGDIAKFSKDTFLLFEDLARSKALDFCFKSASEPIIGYFDPDKVEKILTNLLSNAVKFTESGGSISMMVGSKVKGRKEYAEIIVSDTGIGFKKEQLKEVFNRFFHVDSSKTGTGIGLNFTKGLVEIHHGQIMVESEYQKGSSFIVLLPLNKGAYKGVPFKEMLSTDLQATNAIRSTEYELAITDGQYHIDEELENQGDAKRPTVLIVDDNKELRMHLRKELRSQYKVREAANGKEGLEKIHKFYPDIVISDVMMPSMEMPEMDGFEMCRQVKTRLETCHIPVILLTARSLEEDRIEGYDTGADEYLPKPFNIGVLKARINNLLESKKRLREKFSALGEMLPSSEVANNTLDEAFLDKVTKVILDNISDQDFRLEQLLQEVGMSRSQFYRKINSLTGKNPSHFIRIIRLRYALDLLKKNQYSIKEIAYLSGFNSSAYFTKSFREHFGKAPNQYYSEIQ
ncbi:signal transduction histidine kinase/ligand-binding sensor domain-containing protein/DNA-binding response OmpR family regulator [Catalinimonas alkaloidigena]|uniref:hybrid sensor histidine kinase/response regulator transcription factor n=1 Tax=Catalinimonas alkaloidigena TaxID=1075417 RepID=UPI002404BE09|nr:two-component regulator propeller domain-containing protein [Catalinimonas alkaloidigena]MDF9799331.1 signal transduction histidine kinase/ligand-binding sensor domain-containing protein/DNA-binding response OmpR family regulator [Catalinimonas alkaloidigena]